MESSWLGKNLRISTKICCPGQIYLCKMGLVLFFLGNEVFMNAVLVPPIFKLDGLDQRIVISGVSPETHQRLLEDLGDQPVPRVTYWKGVLQLISPTSQHEQLIELLCEVVKIHARYHKQRIVGTRSMTLEKKGVDGSAQPEASFYIKQAAQVARTIKIDLAVDPPPDLIIEIDITSSSAQKIQTDGLYSQLGIPEIWRYELRSGFEMYLLQKSRYEVISASENLPGLMSEMICQVIAKFESEGQLAALEWFESTLEPNHG